MARMPGVIVVVVLLAWVAVLGAVTFSEVGPLSQAEQSAVQAESRGTGLWFVELSSPPTADGGSLSAIRADQAAFRRSATAAGIRFEERFAFETLSTGSRFEPAPPAPIALRTSGA